MALLMLVSMLLQPPGGVWTREDSQVQDAAQVLKEIQAVPDRGIPTHLLREAQGLVIIPGMKRVGFMFEGHFGRGIAVVRSAEGRWSSPIFVRMGGAGFGMQAGVEAQDLVLVFRTERSMRWLTSGREFTIDVNAGVAAGPVGRQMRAGTNLKLDAEILSYSRARGLFAGLAVSGGRLRVDHRANMDYYRVPGIGVAQILRGENLPVPASAVQFHQVLAEASAAAPVVVGDPKAPGVDR